MVGICAGIARQPVFDAAVVTAELSVPPQTARVAIDTLAHTGAIDEFTGFARNRMWQARAVLDALDSFAERARRGLSR